MRKMGRDVGGAFVTGALRSRGTPAAEAKQYLERMHLDAALPCQNERRKPPAADIIDMCAARKSTSKQAVDDPLEPQPSKKTGPQ